MPIDMEVDRKPANSTASVIWDRRGCIPFDRILSEDDNVLLLTPVVVPPDPKLDDASDPFEPLGRALSRQGLSVRHVPYTKTQGITGVHVAFVKRAKAVVFVITGWADSHGYSQSDLADIVGEICESRPLIVLACCDFEAGDLHGFDFATIVHAPGFFKSDLDAVATLLLDGQGTAQSPRTPDLSNALSQKPIWSVIPWDPERDIEEAHALWTQTLPRQFHLSRTLLTSLLKRDGYAKHYVVREPASGELVGFCATYTTFADSSGHRLVGSIAAIIVGERLQGCGIGRALHNEALSDMRKVGGISRVQLGTTFPRLLYGVPLQMPCEDWLQDRGWTMDESGPGKGRIVADWILRLSDLPTSNLASAGLSFSSCQLTDMQEVMAMVSRESERKFGFGWYDQYAKVIDSSHMEDIILCFEGNTLVATAITYIPSSGSPAATDLPWAASIGSEVGGITCICIKGESRLREYRRR